MCRCSHGGLDVGARVGVSRRVCVGVGVGACV